MLLIAKPSPIKRKLHTRIIGAPPGAPPPERRKGAPWRGESSTDSWGLGLGAFVRHTPSVASSLFTEFHELISSSVVRAPDSTSGITGSIPTVTTFLHFFFFGLPKGDGFQFAKWCVDRTFCKLGHFPGPREAVRPSPPTSYGHWLRFISLYHISTWSSQIVI